MAVDPTDAAGPAQTLPPADEEVLKRTEETTATTTITFVPQSTATTASVSNEESEESDDDDVEVTVRSRKRKLLPGMEEEADNAVEEPEDEEEEADSTSAATEGEPADGDDHEPSAQEAAEEEPTKEADPAVVPRRGPFFMHDTRSSAYAPKADDSTEDSRTLWQEPTDTKQWVHDKFSEITSDDYDPNAHQTDSFGGRKGRGGRGRRGGGRGGGRSRRGKGRGQGARRGPRTEGGSSQPRDTERKEDFPSLGGAAAVEPATKAAQPAYEDAPAQEKARKQAARGLNKKDREAAGSRDGKAQWGDEQYAGDAAGRKLEASSSKPAKQRRKKATIVTVARVDYKAAPNSGTKGRSAPPPAAASSPAPATAAGAPQSAPAAAANGHKKPAAQGKPVQGAVVPTTPKKSAVVRYSKQRKGAKAASFTPSPSAVAAAYQPPVPSPVANMYMAGPGEAYPSSPVFYDQTGQPFWMPPSPMGYQPYPQQGMPLMMDPSSPNGGMPMMMDARGAPMMLDAQGNPQPMDYVGPEHMGQPYYPPQGMMSPPQLPSHSGAPPRSGT
eukprot:CAMPEP_0114627810 /NCGR_PEP_ID=MMETSP0168-20121206/12491_1 /TAXON_ID=95228 ORGANISM="Vannella sp., Strain DIVA3 517/6/12" /NCGR_SAMPLE_ID=MMETSP0168 /ASSEMBLY_ACC=CAM_ASM_000044 /LENGTH=555 /DNA_ID=CAMNT_0001839161 /DNA_START=18 /DNA_END=1682 /DNA_ORIENTATION=-